MLSVFKTYSIGSSNLKDKCVIPANLIANTKANIDFTHVLFLGSGIVIGGAIVLSKVLFIDKIPENKLYQHSKLMP
jgi:hypothetical protein